MAKKITEIDVKRKIGRPSNPLTERTMIRLTPDEFLSFSQAAEALSVRLGIRVSLASWLRRCAREAISADEAVRAVP